MHGFCLVWCMFIRFSAERSPDPVFLIEAVDRHINKDPQKRVREGVSFVGSVFCWDWFMFSRQMRVTMRNSVTAWLNRFSHAVAKQFHFSVYCHLLLE